METTPPRPKGGRPKGSKPPPPRVTVPSAEEVNRIYAERQRRPEWEKRRERERDARAMERDEQRQQERARKHDRVGRDLASFGNSRANRDLCSALIDAGFRVLAKAAHPDMKGGDGEEMRRLTSARDYLHAVVLRRALS